MVCVRQATVISRDADLPLDSILAGLLFILMWCFEGANGSWLEWQFDDLLDIQNINAVCLPENYRLNVGITIH